MTVKCIQQLVKLHFVLIFSGHLQTHDFLQPLEQVGKEEEYVERSKSLLPSPPTMVEHILPGGMGTYSISHISYINQLQSQKVPKHEGNEISGAQSSSSNNNDENSNCSSYTGSGFKLWEDSNVNKGKTRKENNIVGSRHAGRGTSVLILNTYVETLLINPFNPLEI